MDPYRPRTKNGGFSDRVKVDAYLTASEAAFIAQKRRQRASDAEIARMLNCSIAHLSAPLAPGALTDAQEASAGKLEVARERKRFDDEFRRQLRDERREKHEDHRARRSRLRGL